MINFFKKEHQKVFCKTCSFFKQFDTEDKKSNISGSGYCKVCAQWEIEDTPVARLKTITNSGCHLKLNEKNECVFYSEEKVLSEQLKKLRITYKLKMTK